MLVSKAMAKEMDQRDFEVFQQKLESLCCTMHLNLCDSDLVNVTFLQRVQQHEHRVLRGLQLSDPDLLALGNAMSTNFAKARIRKRRTRTSACLQIMMHANETVELVGGTKTQTFIVLNDLNRLLVQRMGKTLPSAPN